MKWLLSILFMFNICLLSNAQEPTFKLDTVKNNYIDLDIKITVEDKMPNDSVFMLKILDKMNGKETEIIVQSMFIIELDYNKIYEISFSHKETNTKTITVDTHALFDQWLIHTGIILSTKEKGKKIYAGSITYDEVTKTFVKKKAE